MSNYRNKKLLEMAKHAPNCSLCGSFNDGTVVAAHSNSQSDGKGTGIKSHDIPAYVCFRCHDLIDGREMYNGSTRERRQSDFYKAAYNTWLYLMQSGLLEIK